MQTNKNPENVTFWLERALLPEGWAERVRLDVHQGVIAEVSVDTVPQPDDTRVALGVPGLGNLHSHAFQRGMAGLSEVGGGAGDSFWSWRELMYRFLDRLDPDSFQAIAEQAYMEMLESGFTRVGEFHYLHHDRDGQIYADRAEMAGRLAAASSSTGIGLTLLPVFYAHADFGGAAPNPSQRRLIHDLDGFATLLDASQVALSSLPDAVLGLAPHSLRAVTPEELALLTPLSRGPIHIHIAEQMREVEACLAWSGQRPVQWLYAHAEVDARWCLVHATHIDPTELQCIADSGAVVGLCPITEANLGDGIFPMREFLDAAGRFGIGSDSNVLVDAAEELRLLEYGQRLRLQRRNVLATRDTASTGRVLFEGALQGAAQALGVTAGLRVGAPADFIGLDANHPALVSRQGNALLDSWVFATRHGAVDCVWRRGRRIVSEGRHQLRDAINARFRVAMSRLLAT